MLYFDTMAQIAIAVGFLLTNNVKKFMSKILAILAKNLDSWPGSTLSWSRLPRSWPRSIRFFRWVKLCSYRGKTPLLALQLAARVAQQSIATRQQESCASCWPALQTASPQNSYSKKKRSSVKIKMHSASLRS